jgi:hypothetical protein
MKKFLVVVGAILVLAVAGCGSTSSGSSSSATTTASPTAAAAQNLAAIQEGGTPSAGDPLVAQFESALSDLRPFCSAGPETLARYIDNAQQDFQKNNRPATLLRVAQSLDTLVTGTHASAPALPTARQASRSTS